VVLSYDHVIELSRTTAVNLYRCPEAYLLSVMITIIHINYYQVIGLWIVCIPETGTFLTVLSLLCDLKTVTSRYSVGYFISPTRGWLPPPRGGNGKLAIPPTGPGLDPEIRANPMREV